MSQILDSNGQPMRKIKAEPKWTAAHERLRKRALSMTRTMTHQLTPPIPYAHLIPNGLLPVQPESCALWMFMSLSHQAMYKIESQVKLLDQQDAAVDLVDIAYSCALMFGLAVDRDTTPQALEKLFATPLVAVCIDEIRRYGLTLDSRIETFIRTGQGYRFIDRDPDKVNH